MTLTHHSSFYTLRAKRKYLFRSIVLFKGAISLSLVFILFQDVYGQSFIRSRPPECRCQFEMLGIPEHKIQNIDTEVGSIDYHSYVIEGKEVGNFLSTVVNFADYPEGALSLDSVGFQEDFFKASIDQAIEQLDGVLIYESETSEAGCPGRLYRIDYGEGMTVKSKVFLVERRFYLIQAFYLREKEKGHLADQFLSSFRLM